MREGEQVGKQSEVGKNPRERESARADGGGERRERRMGVGARRERGKTVKRIKKKSCCFKIYSAQYFGQTPFIVPIFALYILRGGSDSGPQGGFEICRRLGCWVEKGRVCEDKGRGGRLLGGVARM